MYVKEENFICCVGYGAKRLCFCLCFYVSGNALRQLPSITQMNYNLKSDALPLTIADIEKLSERISFDGVSFVQSLKKQTLKKKRFYRFLPMRVTLRFIIIN